MTFFQAVILGLVEGITEFLPISSTGHLILTADLLDLRQTDFLKTFAIFIQLGAILAVVVLYWRRLLVEREVMKRIAVAFIPTALIGLALYKVVKNYLLGSNAVVLWALFLGGLFLLIFEWWHQERERTPDDNLAKISYGQAVAIGLFQTVAMVPGVSRSAATIVGGLLVGLERKTIVEFSFLLAVPTMAAATGLDLVKNASHLNLNEFYLLAVGFIVSFIVALATIKWLLNFIQNHSFVSFGIYRFIVALFFWWILF